MRRVVAVLSNLRPQSPVAADDDAGRSLGSVGQDSGDDLESARVRQSGKDERDVSSCMPVIQIQQGRKSRQDRGVMTRDDFLTDVELTKEHLLGLELFD